MQSYDFSIKSFFIIISSDAIGVYLMSNYDYNFNLLSDNDLYTGICNEYYQGLSAFSEQESLAHDSFIQSENFKLALNLLRFFIFTFL